MQHLEGLNTGQKEAALHKDGPLLIVAGAGAGKTKTIVHRIVNLVKEGVPPESILAVTFTNKAAKEMRERVIAAINKEFVRESAPFVSTFHALGAYIIKENARALGFTKYFTILDESDSLGLIKEVLASLDLDPKQYEPRKIKSVISREKSKFVNPEAYREKIYSPGEHSGDFNKVVARVWPGYEEKKSKENSLDFDDLLIRSLELLENNKEIRKKYQDRWQYIHIDEYQDTNEVQYRMARILSEKSGNICAVGDADQNIYSWRGANLKNILSFEKDFPGAKVVLLEENYRSTQNILEAANTIIQKNVFRPEKNLFTKNGAGEKIGLYEAMDETDESEFVATKALEIFDSKAGSVAVLYRANFQSRALEEAMLRYNIPYQVLGVKFFERKEIRDALGYLRAALNPESLSDIKRIINFPKRGIGKATLAKIFAGDIESLPAKTRLKIQGFYSLLEDIREKITSSKASEAIKFAVKKSGIEAELSAGGEDELERLANIKELATLALKYDNLENGAGVEKLLEDAALASDQDDIVIHERKEITDNHAIKLMTVHASKGLEFDYVFITGLEEGLFPTERERTTKSAEDSEEERRLFYVALTRAKKKVFLSFANYRTIFGSRQMNLPSEFISDIPADLLEQEMDGRIKTIYI